MIIWRSDHRVLIDSQQRSQNFTLLTAQNAEER